MRLAINSFSLKQTKDGWSSLLVRSHRSIYQVCFLKLSSALTSSFLNKVFSIKEGEWAGEARYKLCFPKANKVKGGQGN